MSELHIPPRPSEWCRIPPDGPRPYRIMPTGAIMDGAVCIASMSKCVGGKAPDAQARMIAQAPMMADLLKRFIARDEFLIHVDDSDSHLLVDAIQVMAAAGVS